MLDLVIVLLTRKRVQGGPFRGLQYVSARSPGSRLAPKLLGTYEWETHDILESALARQPDLIVNLGAGEGFYAVGCARRLPRAIVRAFEAQPDRAQLCRALAKANGVSERVRVEGHCDAVTLEATLAGRPSLLICDVEGAERQLLHPGIVPSLAEAEVIAEVHSSGSGHDLAGRIARRFEDSHGSLIVQFTPRRPEDFPGTNPLARHLLAAAADEDRRYGNTWLHLVPLRPTIEPRVL